MWKFRAGPSVRSQAAAFDTDLLVVGCGIAGASSALQAARLGMRVTMLSSAPNVDDCNSFWAQGGIIYKAEVSGSDNIHAVASVFLHGHVRARVFSGVYLFSLMATTPHLFASNLGYRMQCFVG